jgi:hypothetical protein
MKNSKVLLLTEPIGDTLVDDTVILRAARSGKGTLPLIVTIPHEIVQAVGFKRGQKLDIFTDGKRVYLQEHKKVTA